MDWEDIGDWVDEGHDTKGEEDFEEKISHTLAMFFLRLQVQYNVSLRAVQEIAENMVNLQEVSSDMARRRLADSLAEHGLDKERAYSIYNEAVESSCFLKSAQKRGSNSTSFRREKYYTSLPAYVAPGKL